jgi:hypothetical protein
MSAMSWIFPTSDNYLKLTLKDVYDQLWHSQMENSSKALACRLFNQHFIPETYLEILDQRSS